MRLFRNIFSKKENPVQGEEKTLRFKSPAFTIDYPSSWKIQQEKNGIINIFPEHNNGAVTISVQENVFMPMTLTKDMIIAMYGRKDTVDEVVMKRFTEHVEFYHETIENESKWITKVIRRQDKMFVRTINCPLDDWEQDNVIYLAIFNSFRMR